MTTQRRFQHSGANDNSEFGPIPEEIIFRLRTADGDWKDYADALRDLTSVATSIKKRRPYSPDENKAFLQQIRLLAPSFALLIGDLRSSLVKEVCNTVTALSDIFGAPFVAQIDVQVIPVLLKRTCTSKAVIRDTAKSTAVSLFKNGLPAISNSVAILLRETIRNRKAAPAMRQAASEFVGMFLVEPASAPLPSILSALEESIVAGVEDPYESVRARSRENWLRLAELDEPTAAALLERISHHVVPHLEEAFEDEFGRRLERDEDTVTQTLPLSAFDRPVRAGHADPIRRRSGPIRVLDQTNALSCPTGASSADSTRSFRGGREETAAPIRARVRTPAPPRHTENVRPGGDSSNLPSEGGNEPSVPLRKPPGDAESTTVPPAAGHHNHSRMPVKSFRTGLPNKIPDTTPSTRTNMVTPNARASNSLHPTQSFAEPQPVRACNVPQPIRACIGPMPVRACNDAPAIRANSSSPPVRASDLATNRSFKNLLARRTPNGNTLASTSHAPASHGGVDDSLHSESMKQMDMSQVCNDSKRMEELRSLSDVLTPVAEPKAEPELVPIVSKENLAISDAAVGQARQDDSQGTDTAPGNVASFEPIPNKNPSCKSASEAALSDLSSSIGLPKTTDTSEAMSEEPVAYNSPATTYSSKTSRSAPSSSSEPTISVERNYADGKTNFEGGPKISTSSPPASSLQKEPEIILNKGRLSFILGTDITPRKPILGHWARSRFDLNSSDHLSSPESMGRLSGDVGLSIALGEPTELSRVTSTAQRKERGISAPNLDSDLECTPARLPKNESKMRRDGEKFLASSVPVEMVGDEKIFTEDSLNSSVVSVEQKKGDCSSDTGVHKATIAPAAERVRIVPPASQEVSIDCIEKTSYSGDAGIKSSLIGHGGQCPASKRQFADAGEESVSKAQQTLDSIIANPSPKPDLVLNAVDKPDAKPVTKSLNRKADKVAADPQRMRRVTSAIGAPVLGRDRLAIKTYGDINSSGEGISRRLVRHSVMPVAATDNQKSFAMSGMVRPSTRTGHGGVSRLANRAGPSTIRATLRARLPRSVVTTASQKAVESRSTKTATPSVDGNVETSRIRSDTGSTVSKASSHLRQPLNSNTVTVDASKGPPKSRGPFVGADKTMTMRGESSKSARSVRLTVNDASEGKARKENRQDTKSGKSSMRATADVIGKNETPSEKLQVAVRKLRSVTGRGRGDWRIRLGRVKDVKESLQCIDRDNLNAKVTEDCVLVIGEMVNDGHHRVVVAALDSLFLLLLRVEGEAESTALQKVLERKADVLRKVLHLCKDSKEDIRLACQRVLQSFEVQFSPEVQVGLLLRAMGIETGRGGKGRMSSARVGYSNSATVGSDVRVLESGCRSVVKAYERAQRCEGGFVWSPAMLEVMLVGMAKLTKDKHVEIRRGADGVVKAVRGSLPDGAFELACQRYSIRFACVEGDGNEGVADGGNEEK